METLIEDIERWYKHGKEVNDWYIELCRNPHQIGVESVIEFFHHYTERDLKLYHYNHDISKPYVKVVDSEGKVHYPNHSYESQQLYIKRFGEDEYSDMILHDMDFHRLRGDAIKETWKLPFSNDLYATAWAEVYANAQLFGGTASTSFKIKFKQLVKALKKKD